MTGLAQAGQPREISWLRDEQAAFEQAGKQQRFVILYLEAVWCHWCHVMDHQTYADPRVQEALAAHYVPLRIDQDSRPDLAERYKDYGWPATIVFAADGSEIVKRQGYIEASAMRRLLDAIVADPSPESIEQSAPVEAAVTVSSLPPDMRTQLQRRHHDAFDSELGSLKISQKYLDRDEAAYSITLALAGNAEEKAMARKSLDAARQLIDPVWGGAYQYSTNGDWQHPHFEKLGIIQAEYLRVYSQAYAAFGSAGDLGAAKDLRRYIDNFLSAPDGGFYASQDADLKPGEHSAEYFALADAPRRALGVPRVDRHEYAREAGLTAEALVAYYEATGDESALQRARRAANWATEQRHVDGGGFRHDTVDHGGPYLADTLAMGRAFLALYRSSAERIWLQRASEASAFIDSQFRAASGYSSGARGKSPIAGVADIDQNMAVARFANALARISGVAAQRAQAEHALSYLARPEVGLSRISDAGILLADYELNRDPLHLTVIGGKSDASAQALFASCRSVPGLYKRLEWWDPAEGKLPNPDIDYPVLKKSAAFVCTEGRCSTPIFKPDDVAAFLAEANAH